MAVSEKIYCAFCRLERRVYPKKNVSWTNVVLAFGCALVLTFVFWGGVDPRAILIFVFLLASADVFIRIRWRMALTCPHCGFDPLLYKRDPDETVKRVKARLDEVRRSEQYLFQAHNPLSRLPAIHAEEKGALHQDSNQPSASAPQSPEA